MNDYKNTPSIYHMMDLEPFDVYWNDEVGAWEGAESWGRSVEQFLASPEEVKAAERWIFGADEQARDKDIFERYFGHSDPTDFEAFAVFTGSLESAYQASGARVVRNKKKFQQELRSYQNHFSIFNDLD